MDWGGKLAPANSWGEGGGVARKARAQGRANATRSSFRSTIPTKAFAVRGQGKEREVRDQPNRERHVVSEVPLGGKSWIRSWGGA